MGLTVLIVEDEPLIRLVTATFLSEEGYQVIEASDANEALAILNSGVPVNLLFSDIRMPGSMDGCALAAKVAVEWPSVRIVLTSGYDPKSFGSPVQSAFAMVPKPYHPKTVLQAIRSAIGIGDLDPTAASQTA